MHQPTNPLGQFPKGKALLENQEALRKLLADPSAQKLLRGLQNKTEQQLQKAAQSALQGDTQALQRLAGDLLRDRETAAAVEKLKNHLP